MASDLDRAAALLGPLEARVMRLVWTGTVPATFFVRDVNEFMPELAYTTVMTTVRRLAEKGLLDVTNPEQGRALAYRARCDPGGFLSQASERAAQDVVQRFGQAALAAFAAQLDTLSADQRRRLDELRE